MQSKEPENRGRIGEQRNVEREGLQDSRIGRGIRGKGEGVEEKKGMREGKEEELEVRRKNWRLEERIDEQGGGLEDRENNWRIGR